MADKKPSIAEAMALRAAQMKKQAREDTRPKPSVSISATKLPGQINAIPDRVLELKRKIEKAVIEHIDGAVVSKISKDVLFHEIRGVVQECASNHNTPLSAPELNQLTQLLVDDMFGFGPLEPLLADETVTDIMVNAPDEVYVERKGKIVRANVQFHDTDHIAHIATRIATRVGRRVDESSPMVDARLADGSRVNITFPPLSFKSPTISIRKFASSFIGLDQMVRQGNLSANMATFLKIATRAKMNILISGGTGTGKTTLLNAISEHIDGSERIITIEDAAELRLKQPHTVTLESRPANLEGKGEITIRDLLINTLRMRPDRIILGEVRGGEAFEMLQAMNTGHDGSLGTIHANTPRDALARVENLCFMSGVKVPAHALRAQVASAIDIIVQVSRMRDGIRRITDISEVIGTEGDIITMQNLFKYQQKGEDKDGNLLCSFVGSGIPPRCLDKIALYGLDSHLKMLIKNG